MVPHPRADFEVVDDWHAIGLRGTGSKTLVVADAFIPDGRVLDDADIQRGTSPGREINPHPMYGGISQANFTAAHHGLTWDWQADQWTRAAFGLPAPEVNA